MSGMPSGTLYILLEGNDDERFFRTLLVPRLLRRYRSVKIWKYAREKRKKILRLIRVILRTGAEVLYVRDLNSAPSIRVKKREIRTCYEDTIPERSMIVVVMEIESWFMAGPPPSVLNTFGINLPNGSTDTLTKEGFNRLIPSGMARIQFLNELLAHYDFEWATRRNASFEYFVGHWLGKRR